MTTQTDAQKITTKNPQDSEKSTHVKYINTGEKFNTQESSVTQKTITSYENRVRLLIQKMQHETDCSENPDPEEIARWFTIIESARLSKSSVRVYRPALTNYFESDAVLEQFGATSTQKAIEIMRTAKAGKKADQTSAGRAKTINEYDMKRLMTLLERRRGYAGKLTSAIFQATVKTGLRPVEWFTAKLYPYVPIMNPHGDEHQIQDAQKQTDLFEFGGLLVVQNAKATNGRGNGDTRTLWIPPNESCANVLSAIELIRIELEKADQTAGKIQRAMQKAIQAVKFTNRSGKHVSLYTARHQFAANLKSQTTIGEVANLMGHSSIDTSTTHYGKRISAHKSLANKQAVVQENTTQTDHIGN